jgi:hypothetical protein
MVALSLVSEYNVPRPIRVPVEYVENPGKGRLGRLSRIRGKTADAGYMKRCVTLV